MDMDRETALIVLDCMRHILGLCRTEREAIDFAIKYINEKGINEGGDQHDCTKQTDIQ